MKKVIIGFDHAAYDAKEKIKEGLSDEYEFVDLGTDSDASVDYPIYGEKVAQQVALSSDTKGVVVCGSGNGICIAANKVNGIRCALGYSVEAAIGARQHNNANIISIPGRHKIMDDPVDIVRTFLTTEASDEERHVRRVKEIMDIEKANS